MWVCRAGKDSVYYDLFVEKRMLYLPWEGFRINLSSFTEMADFRRIVADEKETSKLSVISSLACQLDYFCNQIQIGDVALIPTKKSQTFTLCKVIGNYRFNNEDELPHSRPIEILQMGIPKSVFPQAVQHSLGSFRTIFKAKDDAEIIECIRRATVVVE